MLMDAPENENYTYECTHFWNFENLTYGGTQNGKKAKNQHKKALKLDFLILKLMDSPKNENYTYEHPHFRNFENLTYGGTQNGQKCEKSA